MNTKVCIEFELQGPTVTGCAGKLADMVHVAASAL